MKVGCVATMTDNRETSDQSAASSDPAAARHRQYYEVMQDYWVLGRTPNYDWVNKKELEIPGYVGLGPGPHELGTGFPPFVAPPRIVFKKKSTRRPLDFYAFDRIWVISDRFKTILEDFDQEGFEFVRTETLYDIGTREAPLYWFCDVVRMLDCVDEAASTFNYYPNSKRYSVIINAIM